MRLIWEQLLGLSLLTHRSLDVLTSCPPGRQVSYKENEENDEPASTNGDQQQVDTMSSSYGQSIHFQGKKRKLKAPEDETPVKQVPPHTGRNFTNAVWANFDPNQMVSQPCLLPGERQNA